jgi:hypothetical protein
VFAHITGAIFPLALSSARPPANFVTGLGIALVSAKGLR